jgi:threonylcarbamoyladenosine tRNA methylthiotransferase CDKAL1
MQQTVCIAFARGCPRNEMDTALLTRYFELNDWAPARDFESADLIVVATCGFDEGNRRESLRLLGLADKRRKEGSRLLVVGCLPGIEPEAIHDRFDAVAICSSAINQLDEIIQARVKLCDVAPVNDIASAIATAKNRWGFLERHPTVKDIRESVSRRLRQRRGSTTADATYFIRIARGCAEECTYCAIRFATGLLRSKAPEAILAEFDAGLEQGYRRFELIADDIGPYGQDIGTDCVELLKSLFDRPEDFQLVLTDVNPRYMIRYESRIIDLLQANCRRVHLLRVPVQSGSDHILEQMLRKYTSGQVVNCLMHLRRAAPTIPLDTHVLVGFPGETDQDFEQTLDLLRAIRFDSIQVYHYADRPKTLASTMAGKVPERVIDKRIRTLLREFRQAFC